MLKNIPRALLYRATGTNKELMESRILICQTSNNGAACGYYINGVCMRCMCPMKNKGTISKERCPIGKW